MKLENDLVRDVLLWLENDEDDPETWKDIRIVGRPQEQVAYTVMMLAEAGLIKAENLTTFGGWDWRARHLTLEGHQLLDKIRDPRVWGGTKSLLKSAGTYGVKALMQAAIDAGMQEVRKHGAHLP